MLIFCISIPMCTPLPITLYSHSHAENWCDIWLTTRIRIVAPVCRSRSIICLLLCQYTWHVLISPMWRKCTVYLVDWLISTEWVNKDYDSNSIYVVQIITGCDRYFYKLGRNWDTFMRLDNCASWYSRQIG